MRIPPLCSLDLFSFLRVVANLRLIIDIIAIPSLICDNSTNYANDYCDIFKIATNMCAPYQIRDANQAFPSLTRECHKFATKHAFHRHQWSRIS